MTLISGTPKDIYTVARLNREARGALLDRFPLLLWVEGELSNFSRPASGHWYFTLKDAEAQVRCAMYRRSNLGLRLLPKDGMHALVQARVGLYEPRGEFQLTIEHLEPAGAGLLQRAFEVLKQKLAAEGLFDAARKKPLPRYPNRLGVITSQSGAALRDILSVLRRRLPSLPVRIYPTAVQGEAAAQQIVRALALANRDRACDVLLLARGGGSLEDLWPFNEEAVARAIAASAIPIVCGVGHEIDFTIADFVADLRAPTPSAAAELVSADSASLLGRIGDCRKILQRTLERRLRNLTQQLAWLQGRLQRQHPRVRLQRDLQRIDELQLRALGAVRLRLRALGARVLQLDARVHRQAPQRRIAVYRLRCTLLAQRLEIATQALVSDRRSRLLAAGRTLAAISPLATLERGYALVYAQDGQRLLRSSDETAPGEDLHIRLAHGGLGARVTHIKPAGG